MGERTLILKIWSILWSLKCEVFSMFVTILA